MPNIAFVGYSQCLASSICLPAEMFNAAFDAARLDDRTGASGEQQIAIYGDEPIIHCAGGSQLAAQGAPTSIEGANLIILPAIWRNPAPVVKTNRSLLPLIKRWHEAGTLLCAVGTGSCFLAEAGVLDQRPAATHWAYLEQFTRRYPEVQLQKNFLITQAGNLYCAGSVNAIADLVIHFIEILFSRDIARRVETNFSPEVRRSYATNRYIEGERSGHTDEDMVRLTHWIRENHAQPINLPHMASLLGISVRTLNRRFRSATQTTPAQYLRNIRIDHAKDLLRNTNMSVGDITHQVGFQDAGHFGREFRKQASTTPLGFRQAVREKVFN